ncbi:ABC transporter ATP-binding protein [Aureimonas psammosilenae]|uniref:ABC transporter ATP-binding protein n=1 Tax=Aureimonas psammosilenae TaxID=2495496 RepID=UPI00186AB103|nr:ABC transporter ATP-binding protein [Aureimonas psammosilenae]
MKTPFLSVEALAVDIRQPDGTRLRVLDDISFHVEQGETLGIVGESGSGKSILALAVIGLLPSNAEATGAVRLHGRHLVGIGDRALSHVRGRRIGMIFQEPATALNPAMRVGDQIAEGLRAGRELTRDQARRRARELLDRVRIPDAARRFQAYPHELSGGQRQRVTIAIALGSEPELLIADEPTTALDVTVQAEIIDLLAELVRERTMALILVSHDLGLVAQATERMLVLYAGTRMEEGRSLDLVRRPSNPYTAGLLRSVPRRPPPGGRLFTISGTVPSPAALPPGCRFAPRCPAHIPQCDAGEPVWQKAGKRRGLRCIRAEPGTPAP